MDMGRYAITGPLGTGASGTVYTAWDRSARREVALRLVPAAQLADQFTEESFKAHCRAALTVRHRCIAPITAVFELGDLPWPGGAEATSVVVATPRIYGMTLDDVLAVRPVLAPPELAYMLAELAGALSALHRAGLAHGDVSPRNVIVEPAGTLKLVDWFGGGRGERGTPGFRAPEVEAASHGTNAVSGPADAAALARLIVHCAGGQGEFAAEIARILAPWLSTDGERQRPGLAEIGARASEISAGREPLTTGQAPELAGEAMRRAALAAPTEPGAKDSASGKVWPGSRRARTVRAGVAGVLSVGLLLGALYALRSGDGAGDSPPRARPVAASAKLGEGAGATSNVGAGVRASRAAEGAGGSGAGSAGSSGTGSAAGASASSEGSGGSGSEGAERQTATLGPDCQLFATLSAQRDAAIQGADAGGLEAIYVAGAPGLRADLGVADGMRASGVEVEGIHTELSSCVDLGDGLIEVESRQGPYRWRQDGGEWRQEAAGEFLKLRVQLRDGKVESISQADR
ncbi:serine/threonine-protein kinase [Buchananella felis]|uniref:serine/threonine-protein kinase n=1 Tax=Buchananella felis TaxID=3231492 RepID=UPI003528A0EE